jgi:hypothetical protein
MTAITERAFLEWYARRLFTNQGAIVDLGCWLGSTTIPLAMGLTRNPSASHPVRPIYAYDSFVWQSWMAQTVAGTPLEGTYHDGESFLGEFERRCEPWRQRICARPGNLADLTWNDGPIEFLLIDAMKTWELANAIIRHFYSSLIPGKSLLLHQDFAHCFTPWVHLTHYRMRDYFDVEYEVPRSTSVLFRLREAIPPALLTNTSSIDDYGLQEIDLAFDSSLGLVSRDKRPNIIAAKIMCLMQLGKIAQARRELEDCRSKLLDFDSDLAVVERRLGEYSSA